jgi:DNA-directed RNA polymerase subunit K/omega
MNDLKNSKAAASTVTVNRDKFDAPTGNIYEAISITAKRAIQINAEIKKELLEKLEEFATYSDSLEEVLKIKNRLKCLNFTKNYLKRMLWLF